MPTMNGRKMPARKNNNDDKDHNDEAEDDDDEDECETVPPQRAMVRKF